MPNNAPPPHSPPPEQQEAAFFTSIREWGITRGAHGILGGVAEGAGARIGMAPLPARIILVIAGILLTGIVLLAYAAAWALLPDREGNIVIQNFGRGITNVGALVGIAIFTVLGLIKLDHGWFGNGFGFNTHFPFGSGVSNAVVTVLALGLAFSVLAGLAVLVVYLVRNRQAPTGPTGPTGPTDPSGPAGPTDPATDPTDPTSVAVPEGTNIAGEPAFAVPERTPVPPAAQNPAQPQPWEAALMPGAASAAEAFGAADANGASASAGNWGPRGGGVPPMPAAPSTPRPPRRRVPGPGKRFYLITAAWVPISIAIIAATERLERLAVDPGLAWLALFTVGFGLILVAIAVTGRKLGFLGFLSIPLLMAALITSVNSGEIRDAYEAAESAFTGQSSDYWIGDTHYDAEGNVIEVNDTVDPSIDDPTLQFVDEYQGILVAPTCYDRDLYRAGVWTENGEVINEEDQMYYATQSRLTYPEIVEDTTVDVVAEHTVLTIPRGANLVLRADANAQSTLDWESRGLYCEFWDSGQDNLVLKNPGSPTLTLVVHDDQYANTIEVHETAAVAPTDVEPSPAPSSEATTEKDQS